MHYQYESLPIEQAKIILNKYRNREEINAELLVKKSGSGQLFEIEELSNLAKTLLDLFNKTKGPAPDAQFEAAAAPIIHQHLQLPEEIAGNRDFWTWFTFVAAQGDFIHVVNRRYKSGLMSDDRNFGIVTHSNLYEGLFARIWWRGHCFYDETANDPYDTARRGYVDLWISHVLRQNYGASKTMAKALIEFLFPKKGQISGHDSEIIRALPKLVCAENSVTAFELLTVDECKDALKELVKMIPKSKTNED